MLECQWLPTGGGRGQKLQKFAAVLNGWSPMWSCSLYVIFSLWRIFNIYQQTLSITLQVFLCWIVFVVNYKILCLQNANWSEEWNVVKTLRWKKLYFVNLFQLSPTIQKIPNLMWFMMHLLRCPFKQTKQHFYNHLVIPLQLFLTIQKIPNFMWLIHDASF